MAILQTFGTAWLYSTVLFLLLGVFISMIFGTIAIAAKWESFALRLGRLKLFEYTGRSGSTIFCLEFRAELLALALVGGLLLGIGNVVLTLATPEAGEWSAYSGRGGLFGSTMLETFIAAFAIGLIITFLI